jgi:hypothetical protein
VPTTGQPETRLILLREIESIHGAAFADRDR